MSASLVGGAVTAAWVDEVPVPVESVTAEVDRLRSGPAGARLPPDGTTDGRQLRRWVTQRVVVRLLLERECATRRLGPGAPLDPDPALLGTATADVLAVSPAARAVFASVTAAVTVTEAELRAQHDRDRRTRPERWTIRQAYSATAPPTTLPPPVTVDPATLLPEVHAAAGPEPTLVRTTLGWHLTTVDAVHPAGEVPFAEARPAIDATLTSRARQTAFAHWLDAAAAVRIRLAPGYEHPADPGNPDATHRH